MLQAFGNIIILELIDDLYSCNERAIVEATIQGKLRFVLSTEILDELIRVLDKKFGVDLEVTRDYVLRLNEVTDIVTPRKLFNVPVRDREDTYTLRKVFSPIMSL